MLFVSIGYGIGVGIFVNGELYHGEFGFSGESGHMIIQIDGKKCRCGRNGCWEAYASEYALIQEFEARLSKEDLTIEKIMNMKTDHEKLDYLFTEMSQYIGVGLMNLIYTFNPYKILIRSTVFSNPTPNPS